MTKKYYDRWVLGMLDNEVVKYYENYREEDRITTNNARKIEFLTTIRKFDEVFKEKYEILDCAAGTGAYAFYLADKGHKLTATELRQDIFLI